MPDKFWQRVAIGGMGECWEWMGARDPNGYGRVRRGGKTLLAHRVARMLITTNGMLDDRHILHVCDNPPCCNPLHLWPGTAKDNIEDMIAKGRRTWRRKTHCPQGHEYTEENTQWHYDGEYLSQRCRACQRRKAMKYHWENREAMLPKMRARTAAWKLARKSK